MVHYAHMDKTQAFLSSIRSSTDSLRSYGVKRIGIFGSVARGEASSTSDIDVIVDFEIGKKTYRNFIGTTSLLEQILNRPVDAITPGTISPYIKPYIEKDVHYVQIAS